MIPSKLTHLTQFKIENPCPEDWEKMEGGEQRRFCAGCGCYVNNLAAMTAHEAEQVLADAGRVCVRSTSDPKKGILTKDGWIPRLLLAGAIATAAAGCSTNTGEAIGPEPTGVRQEYPASTELGSTVPVPAPETGEQSPMMGKVKVEPESNPRIVMGDIAPPSEPQKKNL